MSSSRNAQGPRGDGRRWPIRADHETAESVDSDKSSDRLRDVRWPAHQRAGSQSADGRNDREVADARWKFVQDADDDEDDGSSWKVARD